MVIKCDELHPVPVHLTWHHVAIDFIGPLMRTPLLIIMMGPRVTAQSSQDYVSTTIVTRRLKVQYMYFGSDFNLAVWKIF